MVLLTQVAPPGERRCGSCSACCKTHAVEDPALYKPPGKWCKHCVPTRGCAIYTQKPGLCSDFVCEWIKGCGAETHRPDRTKVVLDYVALPDGLPGGVLQMWELTEGSLLKEYAKEVTLETLHNRIWVTHIYLGARRKRLFVPPGRPLEPDIVEGVRKEGMELCSIRDV